MLKEVDYEKIKVQISCLYILPRYTVYYTKYVDEKSEKSETL